MACAFEVMICYDIEDNRERTRLFEALKDLGMVSIQKSVMWGILLKAEIGEAKRLLDRHCDPETDRAFITDVPVSESIKKNSIGYGREFDDYKRPFHVL